MSDTCDEGYFCDDDDCECVEHFCNKHQVDLREFEEDELNGAIEGNCLYCVFEGRRFDFQSCTREYSSDPERVLHIAQFVINLGFFDYLKGTKPEILKTHKSAKKIVKLYENGQLLAKNGQRIAKSIYSKK